MQSVQAYTTASQTLNHWIEGAQAFMLLSTATDLGLLEIARVPTSLAEFVGATGLDLQRVTDLVLALEAHGVVERHGDRYQLASDFAVLTSPTAPFSLADRLHAVKVYLDTLAGVTSASVTYTEQPGETLLAVAQGIGTTALSPARSIVPTIMGRLIPEVQAMWQAGARHLELGCGVGNNLLGILATYPTVKGVGVDIDAAPLAEGRRRAEVLGLSDRVEWRHADARDLSDEAAFDTAQWSQFFFPSAGRQEVLAGLRRALKPGGYLFMPLLGTLPSATEERRTAEGRAVAIQRLLFHLWDIPVHDAHELQAEVEGSGFEVIRSIAVPASPLALTRGVVVARRPEA